MFAELAGVDLTGADFYWALFHGANLEKAAMAGCDLRGAAFHEANLRHADLSGANCGLDKLGGSSGHRFSSPCMMPVNWFPTPSPITHSAFPALSFPIKK